MHNGTADEGYKVIVCFYADGETNYYSMVANAITSLLANTSIPDVGLLVPSDNIKDDIQSSKTNLYIFFLHHRDSSNICSSPKLSKHFFSTPFFFLESNPI
jgi:hypothetical protein